MQAAATPAASTTTTDGLTELWFLLTGQSTLPTNLGTAVNGYAPFASLFYNTEGLPYFSIGMGNTFTQISKTLGLIGGAAPAAAKALPGLGGLGGLLGGGAGAVHPAAAIGGAASIGGKLSVPVAWTGGPAVPAMGHSAIPVSAISAAPEARRGTGQPARWHAPGRSGQRHPRRRRTPLRIPPHRHGPTPLRRIATTVRSAA